MRNPPGSTGGQRRESSQRIANRLPCPLPCLYADQHHEHRNAAGYALGTSCALCGQTITRSEWLHELNRAALQAAFEQLSTLPPFPGAGERL